jgi:Undecaprenyl-phosphate glucose phosphotransferase
MGKIETTLHGRPVPHTEAAQSRKSKSERPSLPRAILNAQTLPVILGGLEGLLVAAVCYQAGAIYHRLVFGHLPYATFYLAATFFLAAMFVIPCGFSRDYSIKRLSDIRIQLGSVVTHWNTAYALFVVALFMIHATDFYSRGSLIVQYAAGLLTAVVVRLLAAHFIARAIENGSLIGSRVVIIGEEPLVSETVQRLRRNKHGAEIADVIHLDSQPPDTSIQAQSCNTPDSAEQTRSAIEKAETIARGEVVDDIVLSVPWPKKEQIRTFVDGLSAIPATIHTLPDPAWMGATHPVLARVGGMHTIRLARTPLTRRDRIVKRIFDLVVASTLLIASAPLLALVALLIKVDSKGPAIFRQRRHGFNQLEFRVFKFRTMTTLDDGPVIRQATRNDARVTYIGRFLRATNIDELPQLINVIKGDMSLVGPRPHAVAHNNAYEEKIRLYARRHNVKPGITGWAQIRGFRGETDSIQKMRDRVEHDLYYIDHWSLMFDIKILLMTLFSLRSYRNAY